MTTPTRITGFEYGVATPVVSGTGICDVKTGSPTIVSGTAHSGSYSLMIGTAAATTNIGWSASGTVNVGVFYFMWHTIPSGTASVARLTVAAGASPYIMFDPAATALFPRITNDGSRTAALAADTWYRIDYYGNCGLGTTTLDMQLNGTAVTQQTLAQSATTFNGNYWGWTQSGAVSGQVFYDDIIVSATVADYPIGAAEVVGLSPSSDGTHVTSANTIEFQDGTDVANGTATTNAYTAVNTVPMGGTTSYLRQAGTGTYYAELKLNSTQTSIIGAAAMLAYRSSTTTADNGACYIINGAGATTTVWGNPTTRSDYSETSTFYKQVVMTNPITSATINDYKWRCGNSSDVTPNPWWLDLMLEVAYTPSSGASSVTPGDGFQTQAGDACAVYTTYFATGSDGFQTQTGDAATVRAGYNLTPADGFQAQTGDAAGVSFSEAPPSITPADGFQAQTGDAATVRAWYPLSPAEGLQAQTGDAATVRAGYNLTGAEGNQTQTGDSPTVRAGYVITFADGFQTQTGDTATLTELVGVISVTPGDGFQAQTGDAAGVATGYNLSPAEGNQSQLGEIPNVRASYPVSPVDGFQSQTGDSPVVFAGYFVVADDGYQTQTMDAVTLAELAPAAAQTPRQPVIVAINSQSIFAKSVHIDAIRADINAEQRKTIKVE